MDKKICDVCGTPINLTKGNIYLVKDEKMTGKHVLYDAVDCEQCGCQNVLKERKVRVDGRKES